MEDFKHKYEEFYYDFARPIIREHNLNRTKRIKKMLISQCIVLGGVLLFISWLSGFGFFFSIKFGVFLFLLAIPLIFIIFNLFNPVKDYEAKLKYKIMDKFLEIFGTLDWHHGKSIGGKNIHINDSIIFPKNFILSFDDKIYGWYKDKVEITINECKTERNSFLTILPIIIPVFILTAFASIILLMICFSIFANGKSMQLTWYNPFSYVFYGLVLLPFFVCFKIVWSSINRGNFQGLVVQCKLPKDFSGLTYLYEKNPFTNKNVDRKLQNQMQLVILEDVEFSKNYHVFSDNQIEARYVLTSAFINRLNNIKSLFKSKYMRAEFRNNEMLLIIQTGQDMFTFNQFKKLSKSDFDNVFKELCSLFALIDELKLDVKTGL